MQSLIGNIEAKIDAKGRVFLPAQLRRQLPEGEALVIRKGIFNDCLELYPESVWSEMISVMRTKLSRFNKQQVQTFRQFVAEADRIDLEENGRMLIPKRLADAIGLNGNVRFVGCDSTIEIWPSGKVEETFMATDDFANAIESLMSQSENNI